MEEPSALFKLLDYLAHYNQVIDLLVILPFLVQLFVSKDDIDLDTVSGSPHHAMLLLVPVPVRCGGLVLRGACLSGLEQQALLYRRLA